MSSTNSAKVAKAGLRSASAAVGCVVVGTSWTGTTFVFTNTARSGKSLETSAWTPTPCPTANST